jgi:hypothetical protein
MDQHYQGRYGGAVFIAVLLIFAMVSIIAVATERWVSTVKGDRLLLQRQKAAAAADVVASLVEARMINRSFDQLAERLETTEAQEAVSLAGKPASDFTWWHLQGCCYVDASGAYNERARNPALWINGCLVRWRIEPVSLNDTTFQSDVAFNNVFINPPNAGDNIVTWQRSPSVGQVPAAVLNPQDVGYYYRIVTEAYAMKEPSDATRLTAPWIDGNTGVNNLADYDTRSEVMRIFQMKTRSVFDYALIHLDEDLVIQTGTGISIQNGPVHSNGAIYINGGEFTPFNNIFNNSSPDYHLLASGDWFNGSYGGIPYGDAQSTRIGTATNQLTVTAVNGIHRTGKLALYCSFLNGNIATPAAGRTALDPNLDIPNPVDVRAASGQSGPIGSWCDNNHQRDLNGDDASNKSDRVEINGIKFTSDGDSRSHAVMKARHNGLVLDSQDNVERITLTTQKGAGDWFLEPQQLVSAITSNNGSITGDLTVNAVGNVSLYGPTASKLGYVGGPVVPRRRPNLARPGFFLPIAANTGYLSNAGANANVPVLGSANSRNWTQLTMTPLLPNGGSDGSAYGATMDFVTNGAVATRANGKALTAEGLPLWWNAVGGNLYGIKDISFRNVADPGSFDWGTAVPVNPPSNPGGVGVQGGDRTNSRFLSRSNQAGTITSSVTVIVGRNIVNIDTDRLIGTGFSRFEAKETYLREALFDYSKSGIDDQAFYNLNGANWPNFLNRTGLTIRELPCQRYVTWQIVTGGAGTVVHNLTITNSEAAGVLGVINATNALQPGVVISWPDGFHQAPDRTVLSNYMLRPANGTVMGMYDRVAMVRYLCSNYNVLFMGRNVTAEFFSQILTAPTYGDCIATEDEFVDARESLYLASMYADGEAGSVFNPMNYRAGGAYNLKINPGSALNYRVNALTIGLRSVMTWLRTNTCAIFDGTPGGRLGLPAGTLLRDHFNGLFYVHRTRRSLTYHPLWTPIFDWVSMGNTLTDERSFIVNDRNYPFLLNYAFVSDFAAANNDPFIAAATPNGQDPFSTVLHGGWTRNAPWNWREAMGPVETMRGVVRIRGGLNSDGGSKASYATVNWNSTSVNASNGLTFVTPNRLYMWGDFNSVNISGASRSTSTETMYPPCALWADGITSLSPNWSDSTACCNNTTGGLLSSQNATGGGVSYSNNLGTNTIINSSIVQNNVYTNLLNAASFGGTITDTFLRPLEQGNRIISTLGSMVFVREQRYTHSPFGYAFNSTSYLNRATRVYSPPTNNMTFNGDLKMFVGRPPVTPLAVTVNRMVDIVDDGTR